MDRTSGRSAEWLPDLTGRTVVVTGANTGIGFAGSAAFARVGATVVMACRSVARGNRARDEIDANLPEADLEVRACDLADLSSVASFAEGVRADHDGLHVLCNNAGVMAIPRRETADGFEYQLGVNHLGHFALTGQLFPLLAAADGQSRVVTQSSGLHERGEMDFSDLHWETAYDKWDAYGRSKLANLLFAYELQRRLDARDRADVLSVACHPGYADTNLQARTAAESGSTLVKLGMRVANALLAQSAERGALPMLYAATADVDGGDYVGPGGLFDMRGAPEIQESSAASRDEAHARRLWNHSVEATGVTYPFDAD